MIYHQIFGCSQVPGLEQIYLIGDFEEEIFATFMEVTAKDLNVKIQYIKEQTPLGTAGALYRYNSLFGSDYVLLLHSDICCTFPLRELLEAHVAQPQARLTMMGTTVDESISHAYGCYVADEKNQMLHYIEHPESFVSSTINGGAYVISISFLSRPYQRTPSKMDLFDLTNEEDNSKISMERDIIPTLVRKNQAFVFPYKGFWKPIKNAGGAVYANNQYLHHFARTQPSLLTDPGSVEYQIIGPVIVDPTATVDPSAKVGPNVYIGPGATLGPGCRVANSIILRNSEVQQRACVLYAILSEESVVGQWTRVEGIENAVADLSGGMDSRYQRFGICVFGADVHANSELIVRNCIVMPHKQIKQSVFNEIIL